MRLMERTGGEAIRFQNKIKVEIVGRRKQEKAGENRKCRKSRKSRKT